MFLFTCHKLQIVIFLHVKIWMSFWCLLEQRKQKVSAYLKQLALNFPFKQVTNNTRQKMKVDSGLELFNKHMHVWQDTKKHHLPQTDKFLRHFNYAKFNCAKLQIR